MTPKSTPQPKQATSWAAPDPYPEQSLPHTTPTRKKRLLPENQLGDLVIEYAHTKTSPSDRFLLTVSGILWAAILVYASYQYIYGSASFGLSAGTAWSRPGFLLGGGLLAAWLCGLALAWLSKRSTRVHQQGLVFWKAGQKKKVYRWREIGGVSFAQEEWILYSAKIVRSRAMLYPNQAKPVRLSNYCPKTDVPELMTRIKANLYPHLEPELRQSILDGKRIFFGPVSISEDGFYLANQHMEWNQLDGINIENGYLQISIQNGGKNRIAIQKVPNLELLLPLTRLASEIAVHKRVDKT